MSSTPIGKSISRKEGANAQRVMAYLFDRFPPADVKE
jgi:hypothetical protein